MLSKEEQEAVQAQLEQQEVDKLVDKFHRYDKRGDGLVSAHSALVSLDLRQCALT